MDVADHFESDAINYIVDIDIRSQHDEEMHIVDVNARSESEADINNLVDTGALVVVCAYTNYMDVGAVFVTDFDIHMGDLGVGWRSENGCRRYVTTQK